MRKKKEEKNHEEIKEIVAVFTELYKKKHGGLIPEVPWGWTGKMIKDLLKNHSKEGIIRVIELYFEKENPYDGIYHLPRILSAFYMNKYLPQARLNPEIYANAKEINGKIY